jgi:hypothetical protein
MHRTSCWFLIQISCCRHSLFWQISNQFRHLNFRKYSPNFTKFKSANSSKNIPQNLNEIDEWATQQKSVIKRNFQEHSEQRGELEHRDKYHSVGCNAAFNLIDSLRASFSSRLIEAKTCTLLSEHLSWNSKSQSLSCSTRLTAPLHRT